MPRYFIEVSYKGTNYSGFQIQKNSITIQSEMEKALSVYFGYSFKLTGSSRTDAGVHALQNYYHFDTDEDIFLSNANFIKEEKIKKALYSVNSILPADIVAKNIIEVKENLNCRFNAISREYKYYIYQQKNPFYKDTAYFYPYKINLDQLNEAAKVIFLNENFISFSKKNTQVNNFICLIKKSEWTKKSNLIIYNVIANRFLRGMVKGLVGTMLNVATGKISIDEFKEIFENENSSKVSFAVPPHGLFLVEVKYNRI